MINLLPKDKDSNYISDLTNPFEASCITDIYMRMYKSCIIEEVKIYAKIKFKNGQTTGEHEIRAKDFITLVNQVDDFIKSL